MVVLGDVNLTMWSRNGKLTRLSDLIKSGRLSVAFPDREKRQRINCNLHTQLTPHTWNDHLSLCKLLSFLLTLASIPISTTAIAGPSLLASLTANYRIASHRISSHRISSHRIISKYERDRKLACSSHLDLSLPQITLRLE